MEIGQIVRVTITKGSRSITRAGFGTALLMTLEASMFAGGELVREYANLPALAEDFATNTATYKAAAKAFGQALKPKKFKVGKRTTSVAQVVTYTPNVSVQSAQSFKVTLNGQEFDFVSDATPAAAEVVTGLIALINADANMNMTASGTNTLILTADNAGAGFSYSASSNMDGVLTTPNNGVVEDLFNIIDKDNDFYCVHLAEKSDSDIMTLAATIETLRKIFLVSKNNADLITSVTTDIGSKLKALGYQRTGLVYSSDAGNYPECGWAGGVLPMDSGSETWKFKTSVGNLVDKLTGSQEGYAKTKNVNIFINVAGVNMFSEGVMCGGEFIDVVRFIDSLQADIEESVFGRLASMPKVPFTDPGVAVIELEIKNALKRGVQRGGLSADPAPYTEVPKVADVAEADKTARTLPDMRFGGTLAGAIHFTDIDGLLSI